MTTFLVCPQKAPFRPHTGQKTLTAAAAAHPRNPDMNRFQRAPAPSDRAAPIHGAVPVGLALAFALRALPQPANDILRPIADELERA